MTFDGVGKPFSSPVFIIYIIISGLSQELSETLGPTQVAIWNQKDGVGLHRTVYVSVTH